MNDILHKIHKTCSFRLLNLIDGVKDRRICGRSLVEYVPSICEDTEKGIGSTGSQSTHYIILKKVFSHIRPEASDVFMDVGCGKGRVLAYLASARCPCELYGIEHNQAVGKIAQEWAGRYPNVHVMIGDAFGVDYNDYTVLSVARPFLTQTRYAFFEYIEGHLRHPITLIYWWGMGPGLEGRAGWTLKYREKLGTILGLKVVTGEQDFSVWEYDPAEKA